MRKKTKQGIEQELRHALDIEVRAFIEREVRHKVFTGTLPDGKPWEATVSSMKVEPITWEKFECTIP